MGGVKSAWEGVLAHENMTTRSSRGSFPILSRDPSF